MPFYRHHIYPHLVTALGDPPPIRKIRERIVPVASGKVLEIGVGPGVNFGLYDSSRVSKVYARVIIPPSQRHLLQQCVSCNLQTINVTAELIIIGSEENSVNPVTIFGLFAVTAMLVTYTLEKRSHWYILAFAMSCGLGSAYGFLQGAWPFGIVEAIWAMVAVQRWRSLSSI